MDQQRTLPPSGIPRPSRLPLPTGNASKSLRPTPSRERLQADRGLNMARLRRPSEEVLNQRYSRSKSPGTAFKNPHGQQVSQLKPQTDTQVAALSDHHGDDFNLLMAQNRHEPSATTTPLRSKPSLSERTIETLAQIPPSPSPKRQAAFFAPESPMGLPSRPASSMKAPAFAATPRQSSAPSSRGITAPRTTSNPRSPGPASAQRSVSVCRDYQRATMADVAGDGASHDQTGANTDWENDPHKVGRSLSVRTSKPRPSLGRPFGESSELATNGASRGKAIPSSTTRKFSQTLSSIATSPVTSVPKVTFGASPTPDGAASGAHKDQGVKKTSKSSNALRESIARAKAARKATLATSTKENNPFENVAFGDPFGQKPKAEAGKSVLCNKVSTARKSGHLNISALGLKEIPREVMMMYEFDPESSDDWYENVDLVKFVAADNEIETLSDAAFPDVDTMSVSDDEDEDVQGGQFGGLEVLDLRGNLLSGLPKGLRRLQGLKSLNLSNNKLNMEAFDVICEVQNLTELRLAKNRLAGALPLRAGSLCKLEVLDLHGNALTELCYSLRNLASLRVLNVAENRLTSLPFDALHNLPLTEVSAQKNNLTGCLIPTSVGSLTALQTLNVACNDLKGFSEGVTLELPCLQQLFAAGNRIEILPDVSSWQAILTMDLEGNKLSEVPKGFSSLKNLKHSNFTGCNIRVLDNDIGLMDSLVSFLVANNPLRERKFLSMDTGDLLQELRGRYAPEIPDTEEEDGSVQTEFTMAPESPRRASGWSLKPGGILDRSSTEARELDHAELQSLASSSDVRCLYLRRNLFESLPIVALSLIAHSLTDLDLSHNPLSRAGVLTEPLSLPHLQSLTLSVCNLSSLEPLLNYLSAPSLTFLDVSNNSISGPLPDARECYPNLVTFLAADNKIESLDFEAVRGLQVLDVSNNNVSVLPPKLALLGPEEMGSRGPGLRRLEVAGNSFRVPKWQIVSKGTEAVLEWLKSRISDEELQQWQDERI